MGSSLAISWHYPPLRTTSVMSRRWLGTGFVQILLVEFSKKILSVAQWVPKYVRSDHSQANRPNNKVCCEHIWSRGWQQLHTLGRCLTRARVRNTIRNSVCFIRFKKRTMEDRMYLKMWRKIDEECDIINLTGNTERTESSIIQRVARSSSLDVTT